MIEWTVDKSEAGGRLDKFIKSRLSEAPDSFVYKMARKKNLVINAKKCTGKEILKAGDRVRLYVSDDTLALFSAKISSDSRISMYQKAYRELKGIHVIEEYPDFVFLYKPDGILSQKAKSDDLSINEWLIGYLLNNRQITEESLSVFHPSVLNRLDRNTCGIVICGKTPAGSRLGSSMLKDRSLRKFYYAVVSGECFLEGNYNGYIYKDRAENKVSFYRNESDIPAGIMADVKPVSLNVRPISRKKEESLLEIELHTGKSHQIRVMLKELGFPISGDPKYNTGDYHKSKRQKGQLLCAVRVEFPEIKGDFAYLSRHVISCEAPFSFIDN
ncbi:MAG: RluA family pseudouridine synthase [Lachnospiraceae bacterium]|nr:RluA family pseudouridine synthase [Lachnospiraceae bacterium]